MKRVIFLALFATACGGSSPVGPSDLGFLDGTWSGPVNIVREDQPTTTGTMTWTITSIPGTAGFSYRTTIRAQHPWLAAQATGTTDLVPPGSPPSEVSTLGSYASPRGCQATFGSFGTATARRITATFTGVDCGTTFDGHVELTR